MPRIHVSAGLLLCLAPLPALAAEAGTLQAPTLLSAGMTGVVASVPAQAGATWKWTIVNGTPTGVLTNAALFFTAGAVGTTTVTCAVTVAGVTTTLTKAIPVVAVQTVPPLVYGPGLGADALANTIVGGSGGNVVSYRFKAKYNSPLLAVRVFFIWSATRPGYAGGLGGTLRVDVLADDNTAAHQPKGAPLATLQYANVLAQKDNYYPSLAFANPAVLVAGARYHLVFTNIDPNPAVNYVSLDTLYTMAQTSPVQPSLADADAAVLFKPGTGAWRTRPGFTPIVQYTYQPGTQGVGYMEVWSANPKTISGSASVRETFKVTGPTRSFTKLQVRLRRVGGTGPLTARLEAADGTLVEEASLPASQILQGVDAWATWTFPASQQLVSGGAYRLVLAAPAGTVYSAFPMRKGTDKGFSNTTCFTDGHAQFTTSGASGWTGWDMWGQLNRADANLQFQFVP